MNPVRFDPQNALTSNGGSRAEVEGPSDAADNPGQSGRMTVTSRLPGHRLPSGSAQCSCGELAPAVDSVRALRRWHRAHKEERRASEFPPDHGQARDAQGRCLCQACMGRNRRAKDRYQGSERGRSRRREMDRQRTLTGGRPNESGWPVRVQPGHASWLIARSCLQCHVLQMAEQYRKRNGKFSSICKTCGISRLNATLTPESAKRAREAYVARNHEAESRRTAVARVQRQARSLDGAARSKERQQWTGPELELVATRDDLTLNQLASMLGRTYAAVAKQRSLIRRDLGMSPLIAGAAQRPHPTRDPEPIGPLAEKFLHRLAAQGTDEERAARRAEALNRLRRPLNRKAQP